MQIAFVHPSFPSSEGTGATHSATQIVQGLSNRHEVDVYCARDPGEKRGDYPDLDLISLSGKSKHPHTSTQLNRELSARFSGFEKYDVLHSYLPSLIPTVAEIGGRLDLKTFVTLNAYAGVCPKNDLLYLDEKKCEEKSVKKCTNCILRTGYKHNNKGYLYETVSQLLSLKLIESGEDIVENIDGFRAPSRHVRRNYVKFGFSRDELQVIPHPLNDRFMTEHTSDFTQPIKILYVGSLEKHKGVEKLLPIIEGLKQNRTDVYLTVAGTGALGDKMKKQSSKLGVSERTEFLGFVNNDDLPELYSEHDLFIHPGIWEEPLARVYIEALATGTPIVTTQYGSIDSVIGDGGVTTDGSVEDFVRKISGVISRNQLPELSKDAKNYVSRYERDKIISDIEEMYGSRSN